MKVALLVEQALAPVPGGTGRYTREIALALGANTPSGSSITGYAARHRNTAAATFPGVAGPRQLLLDARSLGLAWAAGLPVGRFDAHVVHAPTLLFPRRPPASLVVTIHDAVPWTHPETLTTYGVRWHRRMGRLAAQVADAVVVPTQAVANELAHYLPLRQERVYVIGEGVASSFRVPPDADDRARRLGLPRDYLMTVATLEPRKGLDVAIAALARSDAPALPLLVAGRPGWGGVDPAAEAGRAGLPADRLRLLGHLADPDLAVAVACARALLMPSRSEGFGLPLIEAMSVGTPVIASDAPALVEVAGGAALHVPIGDHGALARAIARIVTDAQFREQLVATGRERAAAFDWGDAARRLWQLYAAVAR